jgi:hypothetical protein
MEKFCDPDYHSSRDAVDHQGALKGQESDGYFLYVQAFLTESPDLLFFFVKLSSQKKWIKFCTESQFSQKCQKLVIKVKKPYELDYYLEQLAFSIR